MGLWILWDKHSKGFGGKFPISLRNGILTGIGSEIPADPEIVAHAGPKDELSIGLGGEHLTKCGEKSLTTLGEELPTAPKEELLMRP